MHFCPDSLDIPKKKYVRNIFLIVIQGTCGQCLFLFIFLFIYFFGGGGEYLRTHVFEKQRIVIQLRFEHQFGMCGSQKYFII